MIMKRFMTFLTLAILTLSLQAQPSAREEINENPFLAGSNYLDYDRQLSTTALTPSPKGYEPFYLTHYGRHGSRWLISEGDYRNPRNTLREAQEAGKLTEKGREVLNIVQAIYDTSTDRLGDLTTVGERQHHGIGKRMTENFPEIFKKKGLFIDARSTVVNRCILSMVAECEEMMAANPTARIHNDVSESLQYYLNQERQGEVRRQSGRGDRVANEWRQKLTHPERLMKILFNDEQYVYNNVNAGALMRQLFEVATNMQSHDTDMEFLSLFTQDEIYDQWRIRNISWYQNYGASKLTGGIMPFSQLNLLKNILSTADTVTQVQATLRFGHEVCVMPLACLLELGECGYSTDNMETLDQTWRNYRIFPMGCNIQLVFYRPKKSGKGVSPAPEDGILVKAMLNERECRLPVQTDQYPYYKWADLRQYYLDKIAKFERR